MPGCHLNRFRESSGSSARFRNPLGCPGLFEANEGRRKIIARCFALEFAGKQRGQISLGSCGLERSSTLGEGRQAPQKSGFGFAEVPLAEVDTTQSPQCQAVTERESIGLTYFQGPRCRLPGKLRITGKKLGFAQERKIARFSAAYRTLAKLNDNLAQDGDSRSGIALFQIRQTH